MVDEEKKEVEEKKGPSTEFVIGFGIDLVLILMLIK